MRNVFNGNGHVRPGALLKVVEDAGFRYVDDTITAFLGGSHQHGARIEGKSDLDILGIYVEPPQRLIGIDVEEHFSSGTSDQYERNSAEDEDYKFYTLRRWAKLAAKGNPTVLSFLFTPVEIMDYDCTYTVWNSKILPQRDAFLASSHAAAFLGFGRSQLYRMRLKGQGKHGQRPELESQHGYDTKAAMHMIRMMYEALELLTYGKMTFPRPEKNVLLSIRNGEWNQASVEQQYLRLEDQVRTAEIHSVLPKEVDRDRISKIVTEAYILHWKLRNLL